MRMIPIYLVLAFSLFGLSAEAKISQGTFEGSTTLTAGQMFLNQVDTVALYLTTENVVYLPHITKEKDLLVDIVFVQRSLSDQQALKDFALRNIKTFQKTLQERLEFYTPQIAKEFDVKRDVQFNIKVGQGATVAAQFKEGSWYWVKGEIEEPKSEPTPLSQNTKEIEKIKKEGWAENKSDCPALWTKSEKVKPQPTSESQPSAEEPVPVQTQETPAPAATPQEAPSENPSKKSKKFEMNANTQLDKS